MIYPKKFKSKVDGLIVEFTSINSGYVTDIGNSKSQLQTGDYSDLWAPHTDTEVWEAMDISESDLVEVWQPKEEELCYFWDNMTNGSISVQKFISRTSNGHSFIGSSGLAYNNCAPFTGTLPEAFKGL